MRELPEARLVIVGKGRDARHRSSELVAELPDNVDWHPELPPLEVARALDEGTLLALPSRSEGLGRVVIEAFARGRGVVASRVGGIPDLVRDGVEGLLVDPQDVEGLARRSCGCSPTAALAERFGAAAAERYREWHTTPAEYAAQVRALVEASLRDAGAVPGERPRVLIVAAADRAATPSADARARRAPRGGRLLRPRAAPSAGPGSAGSAVGPGSIQLVRRWPGPLDGLFFYATLPFRIARLVAALPPARRDRREPYIGFFVLVAHAFRRRGVLGRRRDAWRLARCPPRRLPRPRRWSRRCSTGRRATRSAAPTPSGRLSRYTAELAEHEAGVPPLESFPAYIDLSIFTSTPPAPLPETPTALFVGMLEAYKSVDGARRRVAAGRRGACPRRGS